MMYLTVAVTTAGEHTGYTSSSISFSDDNPGQTPVPYPTPISMPWATKSTGLRLV